MSHLLLCDAHVSAFELVSAARALVAASLRTADGLELSRWVNPGELSCRDSVQAQAAAVLFALDELRAVRARLASFLEHYPFCASFQSELAAADALFDAIDLAVCVRDGDRAAFDDYSSWAADHPCSSVSDCPVCVPLSLPARSLRSVLYVSANLLPAEWLPRAVRLVPSPPC